MHLEVEARQAGGKSGQREADRGVPTVVPQVKNPTSIYEDAGSIPGLALWVKGSSAAVAVV